MSSQVACRKPARWGRWMTSDPRGRRFTVEQSMQQLLLRAGFLCLLTVLVSSPAAQATFHFYDISEVYSSADGSVQFVELFTSRNGQQFLGGHGIVAFQGASSNDFAFIGRGPAPTANRSLLIATASFEAACGIVPTASCSAQTVAFRSAPMWTPSITRRCPSTG